MTRQALMTIKYDGTIFHGWQRQPDKKTVQGEIERALSIICGEKITINGTSRTDAGVHALAQRASFTGDFQIPIEKIKYPLNNILDKSILVSQVEEVPLEFHPRFDAKAKKYIYKIKIDKVSNPFERNYYYRIDEKPDIELMKNAATHIVGRKDFKCFQASGGEEKESTVREIKSLDIIEANEEINFEIVGDGFLYNMVRIIVGTLIEVGREKIPVEGIKSIIERRDRSNAGFTAPAKGLYLAEVYY